MTDHPDWTIPTDLQTLRNRTLPTPDQTRYGPTPHDRFPTGSPLVPHPPEPDPASGSPETPLPP